MNTEEINQNPDEDQSLDLRDDLIRLSFAKEIKYTEKYLKKASLPALEKIKHEYDRKHLDRVNTLLTETLISKFSMLMSELNMIKSDENLDNELMSNKLFCEDVKLMVTKISPYVPFVGLLSGGLTIAKHVWNKPTPLNKNEQKVVFNSKVQNNENPNASGDGFDVVDSPDC